MEQVHLQQAGNAVVFSVKVVPRSSKTALAGVLGGMLKVKLAAAPEKGKANQALIEFLADTFGVRKKDISIIRGTTSPVKEIQVLGVSAKTVGEKLGLYGC